VNERFFHPPKLRLGCMTEEEGGAQEGDHHAPHPSVASGTGSGTSPRRASVRENSRCSLVCFCAIFLAAQENGEGIAVQCFYGQVSPVEFVGFSDGIENVLTHNNTSHAPKPVVLGKHLRSIFMAVYSVGGPFLTVFVQAEEPPGWTKGDPVSFPMCRFDFPVPRRSGCVVVPPDVPDAPPLSCHHRETDEEPVIVREVAPVPLRIYKELISGLRLPFVDGNLQRNRFG